MDENSYKCNMKTVSVLSLHVRLYQRTDILQSTSAVGIKHTQKNLSHDEQEHWSPVTLSRSEGTKREIMELLLLWTLT